MKKLLVGAAALFVIAACGQPSGTDAELAKTAQAELASGIDLQYMDTSVKPGDDFFAYVNGTWLENTEIPSDRSSYGIGAILHDEAQANVRAIVEESANGDFAKGTDEQKVGDLYRSYLDWDTRNGLGTKPLQPELDRINSISDYDDLAVYFAETTRRGLDAPFILGQYADFKDPTTYMMYVWQSGLGLPDREYYTLDDEKSVALREQYVEHIETMHT
ncbi:MAG: peptidase M13, partial [Woeseiaceae bacterium]